MKLKQYTYHSWLDLILHFDSVLFNPFIYCFTRFFFCSV